MEILEIIFASMINWPFLLGLIIGGALGIALSLVTSGTINVELSASLACIIALLFTIIASSKDAK